MAIFKLLAGRHVGADPRYKRNEDGKFTAPDGSIHTAAPSITYGAGEAGGIFVESETDLVRTLGKDKFALVSGDVPQAEKMQLSSTVSSDDDVPSERDLSGPTAVAPGGQVAEGHQCTTLGPDGQQISGLLTEAAIHASEGGSKMEVYKSDKGTIETRSTEPGGGPVDSVHSKTAAEHHVPKAEHETKAELEEMTVSDLRNLAHREDIDLHGASTKDEIVKAIRKARR